MRWQLGNRAQEREEGDGREKRHTMWRASRIHAWSVGDCSSGGMYVYSQLQDEDINEKSHSDVHGDV